jgi:MOSC domain-containing protein YiiM
MSSELERLLDSLPQRGRVEWIGLRPARALPMQPVQAVRAEIGCGLAGDRFKGTVASKRQVTLIQAEHLGVLAALLGEQAPIDAARLRRNIVVSGINLLALQRSRFTIGEVVLEGTGGCHPCSRMESELGAGGFNAMRGHGGITARVITAGAIHLHDPVGLLQSGGLNPDER